MAGIKIACGIMCITMSSVCNAELTISEGGNGNVIQENYHADNFASRTTHSASRASQPTGINVDIEKAIKLIQPDDNYVINIHPNILGMKVSWDGGNGWKQSMQLMAMQNGISVSINETDKTIGLAYVLQDAQKLSEKSSAIWQVNQNMSLRRNIESWCRKAGWTLEWDVSIDYPITHNAVFTGFFSGENNVVQDILTAFSESQIPLTATFYQGNQVLRVHEAGYEYNLQ